MNDDESSTLIRKAQIGDESARHQLLVLHRARLKRMITAFLDQRISARVDASDILQDTLALAAAELPSYLNDPPVKFYPWLRQIAKEQLIDVHRRHLWAQRRSVLREHRLGTFLPDESTHQIIDHLINSETSPSDQVEKRDLQRRVREAIATMRESDSEILLMRFVELLTIKEIAQILDISIPAAQSRMQRALVRLCKLIVAPGETSS